MTKPYQLRVRLDGNIYQLLLKRLSSDKTSISLVVRTALEAYLKAPHASPPDDALSVNQQTRQQIADMAKRLDRNEDYVVEDCVQGILDNLTEDRTPLIVLELRLREQYGQKGPSPALQQQPDGAS